MRTIDLIQPRHNYAPDHREERQGHIYLPTSLHTAAARLANAGVEVEVHDENLRLAEVNSPIVGVNLLGAPYIPEVIKLQQKLRAAICQDLTFALGGQVMQPSAFGLSQVQTSLLFGPNTLNGNDDMGLAQLFGIKPAALGSPENTSLVPIYEKISDADMLEYLSREISFYVSQGCSQQCSFCAAPKARPEKYRAFEVMEKDLNYLVERAIKLGLTKLEIYMSNLDIVQNPPQLDKFADVVKSIKANHPNFEVGLRGLATVLFFNKFKDKFEATFRKLVDVGFHTIGFGVDGWDDELWRKLQKRNSKNDCIEAIRAAKEDFGITPELLMVFGHDLGKRKKDTPQSLAGAYAICVEMTNRYGAVPRPHISKSFIPGNEGWVAPENAKKVDLLIQHPEAFQSLDFTALPSPLTHPDAEIRHLATEYYLKICAIEGATTQHTKPMTPGMSEEKIAEVRAYNQGRYDR